MADRPHIVILGAGFGGLWAARQLGGAPVDVTLIDRHNFHTFLPLLYQVGAAELNVADIARPVRSILRRHRNIRFRVCEVQGVDLEARTVYTNRSAHRYDHLVVATGSVSHFFDIEGAEEHAFPLRAMDEAIALRNHVLSRLEKAAQLDDAAERRSALRFVVVGGGPTGVEFAGALAELLWNPLARDHPELVGDFSVLLLEALDGLLLGMPESLGRYAASRLEAMGIDVRLGARVDRVTPHRVVLADGQEIETETVVWTAGVKGDPGPAGWGLPTARGGRVRVRSSLEVEGVEGVWAVGDLAYLEQDGEALPMVAPVAIQQGGHAADNIMRRIQGGEATPFEYNDRGMLATIGRNKGVAALFGREITGFVAWFLWVVVHIAQLIGFRNKLVVLLNWAWDYVFFDRAVRVIMPLRRAARLEAARASRDEPGDDVRDPDSAERRAEAERAAAAGETCLEPSPGREPEELEAERGVR